MLTLGPSDPKTMRKILWGSLGKAFPSSTYIYCLLQSQNMRVLSALLNFTILSIFLPSPRPNTQSHWVGFLRSSTRGHWRGKYYLQSPNSSFGEENVSQVNIVGWRRKKRRKRGDLRGTGRRKRTICSEAGRRLGSNPDSKHIPWIQVTGMATFVIVKRRHRLMPFPRPGPIRRLLVVCPGVLLWLGAPTDVLPLTEPLALVPRVRPGPTMCGSLKTSAWVMGWCRGPPTWLWSPQGNPRFHPWASEFLSCFESVGYLFYLPADKTLSLFEAYSETWWSIRFCGKST